MIRSAIPLDGSILGGSDGAFDDNNKRLDSVIELQVILNDCNRVSICYIIEQAKQILQICNALQQKVTMMIKCCYQNSKKPQRINRVTSEVSAD